MNPLPNQDTPSSPRPTNSNDVAPASGEEDGDLFGSAEDLSLSSVGGEDVPSWALDLDLTADIDAAKAREKAKNETCKPAASRTSGTGGRSTGHARSQDTKPISMHKRRFSSVEDIELGRAIAEQTGELKGQVWKKIALSLPGRSARQCRDRWFNYLDPNLETTPWSTQEFRLLYLAQDGGFIAVQQESLGELGQESTKQREAEIANPGRVRVKMPSKEKLVPSSNSGGGTSTMDHGGAFSGNLEGLSSTRDLHSSQTRVILVVWTKEEDAILAKLVKANSEKNWAQIAADLSGALLTSHQQREAEGQSSGRTDVFATRTGRQCFERWTTHLAAGVRKHPWMESEDHKLRQAVRNAPKKVSTDGFWREVAETIASRTARECQHRWLSIRQVPWTDREREIIFHAQKHLGSCWNDISKYFVDRTPNEVETTFCTCDDFKKWQESNRVVVSENFSAQFMNRLNDPLPETAGSTKSMKSIVPSANNCLDAVLYDRFVRQQHDGDV
ncbi:Myb protein [Ectocarpus siliculosus]|uniref:Myb protein n=1 Tax=Ectocarpus siliculosus TaxID=2880 RepID=D7FTL6_ECTSI|nr:Myb protein [Ectocarpus siliculosus]|eukprot:CBJ31407.1 Myb protein [Ectocarpus siliculosus]